ncbi:MAG: aminotransferase class IV [Thermomicrobiales bacterium]
MTATGPIDDRLIYLDGRIVPTHEATVHVFDHSFLYGDGIFETFKVADGLVYQMDAHLDRLERSAAAIALDLPLGRAGIARAILDTIAANRLPDCFVKAIVSRGCGAEPLLEHTGLQSALVVMVRPAMPFFAEGTAEQGISAAIVSVRKTPAASLDPRIKSNNYLNVIKSRIEARNLGARESILLDDRGRVVEASIYNIIVVNGKRLRTPAEGYLEGITLQTCFDAAAARGYTVAEANLYPYDLESADEILFTSTAVGVIPVTTLNGRPVAGGRSGPVYDLLSRAYEDALRNPALGTPVPELRPAPARS